MGQTFQRSAAARLGRLAMVFAVLPGRIRAACFEPIEFGQVTDACNGGTIACYVVSPGFDTPESIASSFWSLHNGNSVVGVGNDNGSWAAPEAWLFASPPGNWLGGSWATVPEIDGCIDGQIPAGKPSEIMVTSFSDADVYGTHGYFAVAAVQRHGFEYPQFDFAGGLGQDIELKPIPRPQLYLVTRTSPGAYAVQLRPPLSVNVAEGFYSDGSTTLGDVVVGYKIYKRDQLDRRPPTDRHRNAWTPVTDIVPLGQIATFTYTCLGQLTTYLATSIVYENGFETSYVSANSLPLRMCLDCVDDLDGDGWSNGDICGHEDCNDDDTSTYPTAAEANDGKDNQCPGDRGYGLVDDVAENAGFFHPGDTTRFTWLVQDGASQYEVGRSAVRDFSTGCRGFATQRPSFRDAETPQPGGVFYYLVRPSIPHTGSWGRSSTGVERVPVCS